MVDSDVMLLLLLLIDDVCRVSMVWMDPRETLDLLDPR